MLELIDLTLIFSAIVALSTIFYTVLTVVLVLETRQLRYAQTEPKLVAFVEPREEFLQFAHLYISNVGAGPAFNVSVELKAESNDSGAELLIKDFSKSHFFNTGIGYIASNQRIQSPYTAFTTEFDKKIKAIFTVVIKYKSTINKEYCDSYIIDMSQFEGETRLGIPHIYSITESLKKLQGDINKITTGFRRLKVETYTYEDREREKREREECRQEQIEKSKVNSEKS